VTDETCIGEGDGTITINATTTSTNPLLYSINNGVWYTTTNFFDNRTPGTYLVKEFVQGTSDCYVTYTAIVKPATVGPKTWYKDLDGDGYTDGTTLVSCDQPAGYVASALPGDCNDGNAAINPATVWYLDADNDGYASATTFTGCTPPSGSYKLASALAGPGIDCNDTKANVYPGAPELCDGLDNDCDGQTDEEGGQTYFGNVTFTTQAEVNAWLQCYSVINGNLVITGTNITNLNSLRNIVQVTGNVTIQNTGLGNLGDPGGTPPTGLSSLAHIGGSLVINNNNFLTNVDALQNLMLVESNLNVFFNYNLSVCCGIKHLVDTNLANGKVNGSINVYLNKPGGQCISVAVILANCSHIPLITPPVIEDAAHGLFPEVKTMLLFPNPASTQVTVRISGDFRTGNLIVMDGTGRVMAMNELMENTREHSLNIHGWTPGIYLVRLSLDGEQLVQRLVVQQ
jgi:hypothetical protein